MTKALTIEYQKTFWTLVLLLSLSIMIYLFSVSWSVFNTVALKDAEIELTNLRNKSVGIESKYIEQSQKINKTLATDLGFNETKGSLFTFAGLSSSVSSRVTR